MFFQHDTILIRGEPPVHKRVLWVSEDRMYVVVIDVGNPGNWPEILDMREASDLVHSGAWDVAEGERPWHPLDRELSMEHAEKRDADFAVIRDMVETHVPDVFHKMHRSKLLAEAARLHGKSLPTVKKHLLRYFHGGMAKGALVPLWANCGAPGIERVVREDSPKRGRPAAPGHPAGINVLEEHRRLFIQAASLHYARNRKASLSDAFHFCMRRFFMREVEDGLGRTVHVPLDSYAEAGLPRFEQFSYWVQKDVDMAAAARRRMTARVYEMWNRALLGTSTAEARGPCSRFQIDATVIDTYVRSRRDRSQLIGRPTLYVVIDVFSRLIVGIYVGLESPSWVAAMMALANAAAPKPEFCKGFGIDIEEHEWPARHVPAIVLGDRGEIESARIDQVLASFNIAVENAAAYRADWKGIVERRFGLIQAIFRPYVPGYVETDFRQRGARDYRADAVLDINDLTAIIIEAVLYYNNHHEIADYPRHAGMTQDKIPSVPLDMFNWGVTQLSGTPRSPPLERFRFALMPRDEASVTPEGIVHQGRYYTCRKAVEERWFTKARRARFKVDVSYDKRDVDRIYVHDPRAEHGFDVATLTERSRPARAGLSGWEAEAMRLADDLLSANRRLGQEAARADADAAIERIAAGATAKAGGATAASIQSQVGGIRPARAAELVFDRAAEAEAFRPGAATTAAEPGTVLPFPAQAEAADYSQPTLRDRKRAKETE